MKLSVIFSTDSRDNNGNPVRDEKSVTYNAAIESVETGDLDQNISDFACLVERETQRRVFDKVERQVIIGNGTIWIWNIAGELFPNVVQFINLYYVKDAGMLLVPE